MVNRRTSRAGLSLMECLFATAILSVAVLAVTEAILAGQAHSRNTIQSAHASALAEALMEEIIALPYTDPDGGGSLGPDRGETDRFLFDDCDDFHNFTEAAGQLRDAQNELLPADVQGFDRSVTAAFTSITVPDLGTPTVGLNVQVNVTDGAQTWSINRFIAEPIE